MTSEQHYQPKEPSFITKLKAQVGYKEGPSIDDKRAALPTGPDDCQEEQDDERPTVVVLKDGDLSQEEVDRLAPINNSDKKDDEGPVEEVPQDGRIIFKKPKKKRDAEESSNKEEVEPKKKKKKEKASASSLLSFDDEDEC